MAFDELLDGDSLRSIYRRQLLAFSQRSLSESKKAVRAARACVSGDASFLPLVRLMTAREYRKVMKGVQQRGRALQMFLHDHYIGDRSYESAGIITQSQLDRIKFRYPVPLQPAALRPENIQFWYAPDLVRGDDGNFRVIEDNVGFVGGIGDLAALVNAITALGVSLPTTQHPRSFYRAMMAFYRREARRSGGGKIILLSHPPSQRTNREDGRLARALGGEVSVVTDFRTLKVRDAGLFHRDERVGFVIVNMRSDEIEPASPTPYRISRFWQAVSQGQVGVSYSPWFEFVGDKQFYASVEKLVHFYLQEDCLLPSLELRSLKDARSRQKVASERERWVVKSCRGQSGETVWVGQHMTAGAWKTLFSRVEKGPTDYVAQRYCEPSQFLGRDVDVRPLAVISKEREIVTPIPWGRAAKGKRSKTNIARGGLLAPTAII